MHVSKVLMMLGRVFLFGVFSMDRERKSVVEPLQPLGVLAVDNLVATCITSRLIGALNRLSSTPSLALGNSV